MSALYTSRALGLQNYSWKQVKNLNNMEMTYSLQIRGKHVVKFSVGFADYYCGFLY